MTSRRSPLLPSFASPLASEVRFRVKFTTNPFTKGVHHGDFKKKGRAKTRPYGRTLQPLQVQP
jgi:hypothetical protein